MAWYCLKCRRSVAKKISEEKAESNLQLGRSKRESYRIQLAAGYRSLNSHLAESWKYKATASAAMSPRSAQPALSLAESSANDQPWLQTSYKATASAISVLKATVNAMRSWRSYVKITSACTAKWLWLASWKRIYRLFTETTSGYRISEMI
jgi:hypothetical protein